MFSHGFPYTNFHDLNLDWIIKTVKILFNKSVFSINNIEPDDDGNVTITGAELGAIGTVNNIEPVDGNVTLTASDVGAIATGQGVTKVNGFGPDSSGNVLSGTVRSINGISPASLPTPGNVVLNASDVGALPSTIDPVETVNGISPDAQGNVNVGTVKSVNGSTPDAQGNVNLPTVAGVTSVNGVGPDAQGNVTIDTVETVNGISPDANKNIAIKTSTNESTVTPTTINTSYINANSTIRFWKKSGIAFMSFRLNTVAEIPKYAELASGNIPPCTSPFYFGGYQLDGTNYVFGLTTAGKFETETVIPTGVSIFGLIAYPYDGDYNLPIIAQ